MTSRLNWNLSQLKAELAKRGQIKGWIITQEHIHRRERYFMADKSALVADQDREVQSQNIYLNLFVHLPSKSGRQGETSKRLFPSIPLAPQLDSAIESAMQTDHQAWELPTEIPGDLPRLKTTDPKMAEDIERVMSELTQRISAAVSKKRPTTFNSAELFLSVHDTELHLSNGLIHRSSQSRIYNEAAYSYQVKDANGASRSDEYLSTRWNVSLDDLNIEKLFDETSDRAQHSVQHSMGTNGTIRPKTGKYPVIIDSDVLATLFNTQIGQLHAKSSYHGLPFIKPGDEFVPGAHGDLITITLDPSLEYGADTTAVSEHGLPQTPLRIVEKNRVLRTPTDKRYSNYLELPACSTRGNIVVEPGNLSHEQLTRQAPKVIEILQFSGLFVEPHNGTFSSEIRLAKLYDNEKGVVSYIKGGSLSGSFKENFVGARFSNQRVKHAHFPSGSSNGGHGEGYYGPEYALLSDVSIVGD